MSAPKKRGAQTGNSNALKHGSYSHSIPPDIEWELSNPAADSLENEIKVIRILIFCLSVVEKEPDLELKDPDAAYKMVLLASRRLDIVRTIHFELQDPLPLIARDARDLNSHSKQTSDLYTIQNLDKAAHLMLGEKYMPMAEYLPPRASGKIPVHPCPPEPPRRRR